ncbi:MAG: hypothetical protein JW699_05460 [Chitinispirillaceae bacterium]|nr:hypothetical protein [Chitinispirillaceae bacterium]
MKQRTWNTAVVRLCTIAFVSLFCGAASAEEAMPLIRLVDAHTAGVIPKGYFAIESRLYEGRTTGFMAGVSVGITDRFSMGLGYGAEGIVGRGWDPEFNPFPGCMIKYRFCDETFLLPGMAAGFDYQGYGGIAGEDHNPWGSYNPWGYTGYIYKSEGFFVAASKSYLLLKTIEFGFHGSLNWSLEEVWNVKWPNAGVGFDLGLSRAFSFAVEYDFGLNARDPHRGDDPYAQPWGGYLHAGARWNLTQNFAVELDVRDILEHRKYLEDFNDQQPNVLGWSREIKVVYMSPIR